MLTFIRWIDFKRFDGSKPQLRCLMAIGLIAGSTFFGSPASSLAAPAATSTTDASKSASPPSSPPAAAGTPATPPAQTMAPSQIVTPTPANDAQATINSLKAQIDQISLGLQHQELTDKILAAFRSDADAIKAKANAVIAEQSPDLDAANAKLKQLGPPPKAPASGEPVPIESDAVKQERDAQTQAVAQIEGIVKQAQLISLECDEVVNTISDRRRTRFAETLTERTRSVLDPSLWVEAVVAVPAAATAVDYMVGDWISLVAAHGGEVVIAFLAVLSAMILLLLLPLRRRLFRLVERSDDEEYPPKFRKIAAAAGVAAIQVGVPVLGLLGFFLALQALDLSRDRTDQAFIALIEGIALANAIYGLAVAILAPGKPQWRLVPMSDNAAVLLRRLLTGLAITTGTGLFVTHMLDTLSTSIGLVFAASGLFAVIDAIFAMFVLHVISRAFIDYRNAQSDDQKTSAANIVWRWILPVAWLAAVCCLGAAVLGYISLARYLGQELIWFGVVLSTLFIGLQLIDEAATASLMGDTPFAEIIARSMALNPATVEQFGVLLSGIGRVLAIFVAFYFVRPPWSDSSTDVLASLRSAFFGFKIGNFTFSASAFLLGLVSFGIGVAITRAVQRWLDNNFLPRTRLDLGLKNSISTGFGYIGYVVAAVVAFSTVGIGLENVALVAGALSVGIGFGLQSIVNNFVSGLILLAERPIKSGDLVQIGTEKGYVRKINVRSTEIETFDRASLIVPNSTLISGLVKNWMHRDPSGSCLIMVAVAYDSDVDVVSDILRSSAKAHRLVQTFPGPGVSLAEFGPKALEFQLACTVANVNDAWNVQSDLRLTILKRLKAAGIEMPAADREIRVHELAGLKELLAEQLKLRDQTLTDAPARTLAPDAAAQQPSL
jgi:small-conductance mechanosensitive channel